MIGPLSLRALFMGTVLLAAPLVQAQEPEQCRIGLGRGWPPATENHGTAVEQLFAGDSVPALRFTLLPRTGVESGLVLIADPNGGDWNLRRAVADERVHYWSGSELQLRTTQAPDVEEAPMPAEVGKRLVEEWRHALAAAAPEGSQAPFSEDDTWLFVAGGPGVDGEVLRVSGLRPDCELGELLREQIDLLIEASDEGPEKREKRWRQLGESLDRLRAVADALPAPAAQ